MKEHSYLTFSLNNRIYGISTVYVEEIFALPELASSPKTPHAIIGVVNLRGYILPVIDLNLSFGYPSAAYNLTDSVVVLKWEELRLGIIANEVHELRNIPSEEIVTEFPHEQELTGDQQNKLSTGIVKSAGDILILINLENLSRCIDGQQILSPENSLNNAIHENQHEDRLPPNSSKYLLIQKPTFSTNATPEERLILRQRADDLKLLAESQDLQSLKPLAVIALNEHFFGIDLKMVREFTEIRQVTPIPCCPTYIIGNMNLRGEILTLVDIRGLLHLPLTSIADGFKAMVVEVEGIITGVMVEDVHEVMFFLNPLEIMAMGTAIHPINDEYLQGVAFYDEKNDEYSGFAQNFSNWWANR